MRVISRCCTFFSVLASIGFAIRANAIEDSTTLTVVINGIKHEQGQICLRIYDNERGFPLGNSSEVQSQCKNITGSSLKYKFTDLKKGNYAVAVIDDQNGDTKLNRDFLGIPEEGFGISNNPTVSITTGTPKFEQASFKLMKNQNIEIVMKYSLDP